METNSFSVLSNRFLLHTFSDFNSGSFGGPVHTGRERIGFNTAVFWSWAISFGIFYFISLYFDVFLSFVTLPAWILCGILFLLFNKLLQPKELYQH